uniref:Uncharacterized protein LOC113794499 n=1 Tax=Dermatophagoides pteronyssinus TaxID=6956 RepID=A0A6P6Y562_DERPT|nr:uncharacterized protein LOC113794499 [Dermatophagoides pteronyssinus]
MQSVTARGFRVLSTDAVAPEVAQPAVAANPLQALEVVARERDVDLARAVDVGIQHAQNVLEVLQDDRRHVVSQPHG